jgi:hypothetical protein
VFHRLHLVERQLRVNLSQGCAHRIFHLLRKHKGAQNDPSVDRIQLSDGGEHAFTSHRLCCRLVYLRHCNAHAKLRSALVAAEIAVALTLLAGSGLLLRSFAFTERRFGSGQRCYHRLGVIEITLLEEVSLADKELLEVELKFEPH